MKDFKEVLWFSIPRITPVVFALLAVCMVIRVSNYDPNLTLACSAYLVVFTLLYGLVLINEFPNN